MKRFLIFILALFAIGTAYGDDIVCDAGFYADGETCTACPDDYPNSAPGATSLNECYSNWKTRTCLAEMGCVAKECQYVAYAYRAKHGAKWVYIDGDVKEGCTEENCQSLPVVSVLPGYRLNGEMCEECPAGTYSTGGENAQCEPCPAGTYSSAGATECALCPANTYSAAGSAECTPCAAGYISEPGATECTAACAAGMYYNVDTAECVICPAGTYSHAGAAACTACPDEYPNSAPGATLSNECYSDWKTRTCQTIGCAAKECQYVAYSKATKRGAKWLYSDGDTKEGCTEEDCLSLPTVAALPGYRINGAMCAECPVNTYSTGGKNTQCEPCPNGATTSFPGAMARAECTRVLNYQDSNSTVPTRIHMNGYKNTSPALAFGIGGDVFYANMIPVYESDVPGLYVGYNNQKYQVVDNTFVWNFLDYFMIITTPDTSEFGFTIRASGEFTVDWGDGNVEDIATGTYSHTYRAAGKYMIKLGGRADGYSKTKKGVKWVYKAIEFTDTTKISKIGGSLGAVFPTLSDGTNPSFHGLFNGAINLTGQIPSSLFSGITGSPSSAPHATSVGMFESVFDGCSGLTGQIPVGLFGDLSGDPGEYTFVNAFNGCSGLIGPAATNPDGTSLYDIEYNGQTWYEQMPGAFRDMYTDSGISDL